MIISYTSSVRLPIPPMDDKRLHNHRDKISRDQDRRSLRPGSPNYSRRHPFASSSLRVHLDQLHSSGGLLNAPAPTALSNSTTVCALPYWPSSTLSTCGDPACEVQAALVQVSIALLLSESCEIEGISDKADRLPLFLAYSRSFLGKFILYGTAFHLWSSFVLVRFDDDDTQDNQTAPEAALENTSLHRTAGGDELTEEELAEEDRVFIPLTWSWLEEGELYTASDPEWQEFVTISKDRKKLQKLRGMFEWQYSAVSAFIDGRLDELAAIVLKSASESMSQILGSPLSLTGFWLVHQFPSRAPPEYLRSGYVPPQPRATVPSD